MTSAELLDDNYITHSVTLSPWLHERALLCVTLVHRTLLGAGAGHAVSPHPSLLFRFPLQQPHCVHVICCKVP